MAIQHEVAGPVTLKYNSLSIGFSRDGFQIRIEPKWLDVFSDDYGGASGAPADSQMIGGVALITGDLTKYDKDEFRKLTAFVAGGTEGTFPAFGTLMRQESQTATLLLDGNNEDWTFSVAFPRQAIEVNKGTRHSVGVVGFEAWINNTTARQLFTVTDA